MAPVDEHAVVAWESRAVEAVHFDDLAEGHVGESSEVFADRDDMVAYTERNDPYPIHVDEQFAATSPFGGLVASFGYTVSLYLRIIHDMELFRATGSTFLGVLECRSRFAARSGQATAYTSAGRYRASGSRAGATRA